MAAAEFSIFPSPETESDDSATAAAVDAIVSQVIDSAILKQTVELNSSHHQLSCSSTPLPTQLEACNHNPLKSDTDEAEITPSKNSDGFISPTREYSPSPPRQVYCCFGGASKKNRKEMKLKEKNEGILTDYSTFSYKEQQRRLKKALKEEEKASQEAQKVVEWVKQASARMDVSAIDELLSEDDEKYHK